ncbi:Permease of the drug/metabolite transporter (DMT) superfamily [plant metagenome]|uniref:Permease of the drug/metabolite transporter (DMT) superfamily n=1 Tax=plant metagenome TaxID=1297885 RepID=A0A484UWC5_9ZZZZ
MTRISLSWAATGSTSLFVLLWSSGAIVSRWGLDHGSPFALLTLRFALALLALLAWTRLRGGRLLPERGTRATVMLTGATLIGGYSICYLLALEGGMTPGVLATVLGAQPILTLVLMERRPSLQRLAGLGLALAGLSLVVFQSLSRAHYSVAGVAYALLALVCVTAGAILQKRTRQSPQAVLPLQYAASLALCAAFLPVQPLHAEWSPGFIGPLLWLALVISVGAQLLLYRLIQAGNLVNVTSLFYLVPVVTALMDYALLGNALSALGGAGMAAVLGGLALALRRAPGS